ncbi:MAG: phenylalanine--tRNA ligase subunit beta [Flavobacteriaceae bacterium]
MHISYNWLKQFINIQWEADKTAELLTNLGLEVEGIQEFESVQGGLQGVVVGHVVDCQKHPNADKLSLTKVDLGDGEPVQIVCGAPNVAKGQKVAVATIGTTLYSDEGEPWKIKKGKIRGEESHGMICAEDELGLGNSHDGIMILADDLEPGTPCASVFEIERDQVFEIGLTPNRADAMSHFGVARDLKAALIQQKVQATLNTPSVSGFAADNRSLKMGVTVENSDLAPRYCGVTIRNIIVEPSPNWLQNRLNAIGHKPVNNVVDITNYVLHELGQPLHAFDAKRIHNKKIVVKTASPGSKFMTLDGELRELHEEDLMIYDGEKPMCIAGVFGGINTGVTEDTTSIFLESAYFDPVSIRKTAKRHGLNTDASFRFERGVDINNVEYALKRAALLIKEIAGGEISSDVVDLYPKRRDDYQVFLSYDKVNRLVGQEIPKDTIKTILASLDIQVKSVTESGLGLQIPFYRVDVIREVDVIEEILRVYGYNKIEFAEKINASIAKSSRFEDHILQNITGNTLASLGFYELLSNSLTQPAYDELIGSSKKSTVEIMNPLSSDLSVMRKSLLFSAMEAVSFNLNRKRQHLRFFEFGKTYHRSGKDWKEYNILALTISGERHAKHWLSENQEMSFFYLKAVVLQLMERLGIQITDSQSEEGDLYSEGLTLYSAKEKVASFGVVSNPINTHFDIKQDVLHAELNWDQIVKIVSKQEIVFKEIPKYPEVRRDFALLISDNIKFGQVKNIAFNTEKKLLKKVDLFDVYRGKNLPEGKKSYAVSFTIQDETKTLTDKQIDKIMKKLQQAYEKELSAELR